MDVYMVLQLPLIHDAQSQNLHCMAYTFLH